MRRLLRRLGQVWRWTRQTLHIRDPRYSARMGGISRVLVRATRADTALLYVNEAESGVNPKLGAL